MNGNTSVFDANDSCSERNLSGEIMMDANAVSPTDNGPLLAYLADNSASLECLLEKAKLSFSTAKETASFLKKRSEIEAEYARAMTKLATSHSNKSQQQQQQGTAQFNDSWAIFCKLHERIGEIRQTFSEELADISNELLNLSKNTERSRRHLKDDASKHTKTLAEAETLLEKSKARYESTSSEWESLVIQRDRIQGGGGGEGSSNSGFGSPSSTLKRNNNTGGLTKSFSNSMSLNSLWKPTNVSTNLAKVSKQEEETRLKLEQANQSFKTQLQKTKAVRHQYYETQLPHVMRSLLDSVQECDSKMKHFLGLYAQSSEGFLIQEATTVCPLETGEPQTLPGLQSIVNGLDPKKDLDSYLGWYFSSGIGSKKTRGDKFEEMVKSSTSAVDSKTFFGVSLDTVAERDGNPVPLVVRQCIEAIETPANLVTVGLYRLSGSATVVQKLRMQVDKHLSSISLGQMTSDVHVVTGLLKLYFRELPDSLFPRAMYQALVDASRLDDVSALIRIHELINELPDPAYHTLRSLMKHLSVVVKHEQENKMGVQNIGIIFGPTLLDCPNELSASGDIKQQSKVIEIVLRNFDQIFEV